ncbi:hypothetical protein OBBRIDRAFT_888228 [Obba rivulosa]|uniref:Mixed lineage kinase domain-containing protein n=1 Tax=Obba rivulosa TaxID=1052685 RepID=A0A8E2DNF0_9APHY|nr:hypothetical protein OBBRIDRAFT_888228 [Obba rivulosa]
MPHRHDDITTDIINDSIVLLEALRDASNAVGLVPLLGTVVGAFLSVLQIIERVKAVQDRGSRLTKRVIGLAKHIVETLRSDPDAVDANLEANLSSLLSTLSHIYIDIEKRGKKNALSRFLRHGSFSDRLDEHIETLDSAWRSFDTCCLVSLRQKMDRQVQHQQRQAVFDEQQYRLFRPSDLRLRGISGSWYFSELSFGEEWRAEWKGRAVVVRVLGSGARLSTSASVICQSTPRIYHPHIAQILGYSHPDVPENFYVMEAGFVPFKHCFDILDTKIRLSTFLQMMLDHQDACRSALPMLTLPMLTSYPYHDCDKEPCLQTASLDATGRLLLTIDDIIHGSFACMWTSWVRAFDCRTQNSVGDYIPHDSDVIQEMLLCLKYGANEKRGSFDWTFLGEGGFLSDSAACGDYGYMSESGGFVRLGNVADMVAGDPRVADGIVETQHYISPGCKDEMMDGLPQRVQIKLLPGEMHEACDINISASVSLKRWCLLEYWDQMDHIAQEHQLAIHELLIVDANPLVASVHDLGSAAVEPTTEPTVIAQQGSIKPCRNRLEDQQKDPENSHRTPEPAIWLGDYDLPKSSDGIELYFHRTIEYEDVGRGSSMPWGYWSFDPKPTPGPWPALTVANIGLYCGSAASWHRLTVLEAQLYTYLRQQEQLVSDPTPPPGERLDRYRLNSTGGHRRHLTEY